MCNLSKNTEKSKLAITEVADMLQVSTETIRNWIKTGYLKKQNSGFIDKKSLDFFINTIIGKEKLNSRANKSYKDYHNHEELNEIINELHRHNISDIGKIYESKLSNSYKNKEGIYYTPQHIVEDMLCEKNIKNIEKKTFCDPCCGSGNFIIRALELGFKPQNIYGFDIDKIAVEITKKRIKEKTGYTNNNIKCVNFLDFIHEKNLKFDYIFTNPPWGKKLQKAEKQKYADLLNVGKSIDTSSLFFFASLKCLNPNGKLGFLLPEAFFNIASFEQARKKALELKIEKIIDYGKAFCGLMTKTQAIILSNNKNSNSDIVCIDKNKNSFCRQPLSFKKMPKSIFNFYCNENEIEVIKNIFSKSHITLKNNAKWGLGIVTGNNKKFLKTTLKNGYVPVYRGVDIKPNGLEKPKFFIPQDLSLYQQSAPLYLYKSPKKIIYKFISSELCFFYDTNKSFILNSANMLIINDNFPLSETQIVDLFNSKFINWIFKKIFNTHKILRSDLEKLPIHSEYFNKNKKFNETSYLDFLNIKEHNGTYIIKN